MSDVEPRPGSGEYDVSRDTADVDRALGERALASPDLIEHVEYVGEQSAVVTVNTTDGGRARYIVPTNSFFDFEPNGNGNGNSPADAAQARQSGH